MELYVARQAATKTTRKQILMDACRETGILHRPNWEHPSAREFHAQLSLFCETYGYALGDPMPPPLVPGNKLSYSTMKSWPLTIEGRTEVITWDSLTGDVHGSLRGSAWRPVAEQMPTIIRRAYETAEIHSVNVIDQIAVAIMSTYPAAPFMRSGQPGKYRNSYWLGVAGEPYYAIGRFFTIIGRPLQDAMTITNPDRQRIRDSMERARKRMARTSGWVKISADSHRALLEQL